MTYWAKFVKINYMQYKNFGKYLRVKREAIIPKVALNKFANNNAIEPAVLSRIETY